MDYTLDTSSDTFELEQEQQLTGQLLSLSKIAMVVMNNHILISLSAKIGNLLTICFLDSATPHNFLSLEWYKINGIEFDKK